MILEDFKKDLLQSVHVESDAEGEYLEDIFFQKSTDQLIEAGDLDTADRVVCKSPNRGIRVDGYGGDPEESGGTLSLIILDFHIAQSVGRLTGSVMDTLFKRLSNFLKFALDNRWRTALEETDPAFGLADLIAQRWRKIVKIRFLLISSRSLSERVDGRAAGDFDGRPITYSVWDIRRLFSYANADSAREDLEVNLAKDFGGPIPILAAQKTDDQYESYLAVLPGSVLADIYDRWGARLLEQNVRVFLQARGKVNRAIRLTLDNEPSMFFAYNNGITATAESVVIKRKGGQLFLEHLTNFQIVNGGQTTASIYQARLRDLDIEQTFVQMKLSVVSKERTAALVPKISEFANSQNRVSAADFFANHPFHVRIEEFSRRIYAPSPDGRFRQTKWFYERARGQYADARANLTSAQRKKFDLENPRAQLITKTDLAKFVNVWEMFPHEVSKGAQKNFAAFATKLGQRWKKTPDDFNEAWYRQMVAKAIFFRTTEHIVSKQPWYQGGYRANIVAYAISKIAYQVSESGHSVDFELIWRRQRLDTIITEAIADVAKLVHDVLVNPPMGISNVTEWAKQQGCWEQVRTSKWSVPANMINDLLTNELQEEASRVARQEQRVLNGIEAQVVVVNAGAAFWQDVLGWGSSRKLLNSTESGILTVATLIPARIPTEKQSARALEVLGKLQAEGYNAELQLER